MDTVVKELISLAKKRFEETGQGHVSIDLYYNDVDRENPYTVKLICHTGFRTQRAKHFRAASFSKALFDATVFVATAIDADDINDY